MSEPLLFEQRETVGSASTPKATIINADDKVEYMSTTSRASHVSFHWHERFGWAYNPRGEQASSGSAGSHSVPAAAEAPVAAPEMPVASAVGSAPEAAVAGIVAQPMDIDSHITPPEAINEAMFNNTRTVEALLGRNDLHELTVEEIALLLREKCIVSKPPSDHSQAPPQEPPREDKVADETADAVPSAPFALHAMD